MREIVELISVTSAVTGGVGIIVIWIAAAIIAVFSRHGSKLDRLAINVIRYFVRLLGYSILVYAVTMLVLTVIS